MGDEGRIYVSDEVVPAYKTLLRDADLILPNQFEAEYIDHVNALSAFLITNITAGFSRRPRSLLSQA